MAATVTDDYTTVKDMENTTGVVSDNSVVSSIGSTSSIFKVQGTYSVIGQFKASGVGGMGFQYASNQNWKYRHVMGWVNNLDVANTAANGGWRMRLESVGDSGSWGTNYGDYYCGGADNLNVSVDRFLFLCADVQRPFDASAGTLNRNAARTLGVATNATSGSGQSTWFQDELKYGTKITVTGGTVSVPGESADILSSDRTNGRGTFADANGPYSVTGGVYLGDTGTASSYYTDINQAWNFSNLPVKNDFHKIVLQGNATGTNNIVFGGKTGTGVNEEASGGNSIKSSGDVPFQIEAIDSNVDEGGFYGCPITGPASLRDDAWRDVFQEDNSGGPSYSDITDSANDSATGSAQPFPSGAGNNDACYFGSDRNFAQLKINTGTAGAGTYTVTWEYYNGTSWVSLTDITDGTGGFKTTGTQTVDYSVPDDWTTTAINSQTRFWVRARRDSGTVTTNPVITQTWVSQGTNIRLEASTIKSIRCVISNIESIRVRNGAFLKKATITSSVATAKHAVVDLGSADPTADTVRDLVITDNTGTNGILLKGTSTGTTTYNFRNFQFSNNLKHVRADFPAAATVEINILGGGTALIATDVDNVNSSTLVINNNTNVTFNGLKDNTEVRIYKTSDGSQVAGIEDATAGTPDNRSFAWSAAAGLDVYYVLHHWSGSAPFYLTIRKEGYIVPSTDTTIEIDQQINRNAE